jgi:hypothetical protein
MHERNIINQLAHLSRQPYLVFAGQVEEKTG